MQGGGEGHHGKTWWSARAYLRKHMGKWGLLGKRKGKERGLLSIRKQRLGQRKWSQAKQQVSLQNIRVMWRQRESESERSAPENHRTARWTGVG